MQSKSSSRARAKGDEKEDEHALDTTKRCNNGHALLKTFKGRVETKEIKEYLLRHKYGYFVNKEKETNFNVRASRFGGTYEHIRCRKMRQNIKTNAKRGRPPKRKRALEYQPGVMPSPEKVSKEARVEENDDDEDIFEDAFEACL